MERENRSVVPFSFFCMKRKKKFKEEKQIIYFSRFKNEAGARATSKHCISIYFLFGIKTKQQQQKK